MAAAISSMNEETAPDAPLSAAELRVLRERAGDGASAAAFAADVAGSSGLGTSSSEPHLGHEITVPARRDDAPRSWLQR
jgi:hypothetical protein